MRDVLRYATINGAKHLRLDSKTGSLKPGKEADIIILDATHLNVFPVNHVPGAVVQMMDRSNVETVIVAGKVRKWKGRLLDVDLNRLRDQLEEFAQRHLSAGGRAAEPVPLTADRIWVAGRLRPPRFALNAPIRRAQPACPAPLPSPPRCSSGGASSRA